MALKQPFDTIRHEQSLSGAPCRGLTSAGTEWEQLSAQTLHIRRTDKKLFFFFLSNFVWCSSFKNAPPSAVSEGVELHCSSSDTSNNFFTFRRCLSHCSLDTAAYCAVYRTVTARLANKSAVYSRDWHTPKFIRARVHPRLRWYCAMHSTLTYRSSTTARRGGKLCRNSHLHFYVVPFKNESRRSHRSPTVHSSPYRHLHFLSKSDRLCH